MRTIILLVLLCASLSMAQVPSEYNLQTLPLEFENPMDIECVDESTMVVLERGGNAWVVDFTTNQWVKRGSSIVTKQGQVSTFFERGAQSIVIDGDQMWMFYTLEEDIYWGDNGTDFRLTVNRVSRFDMDWSNNTSSNEVILVEVPSIAANHQGGGMVKLGGELFVAFGDGASGIYGDDAVSDGILDPLVEGVTSRARTQILGSALGKVLRVDAQTGMGLEDNPFYDGNPSSWNSKIWHLGFRNPFDMSFTPQGDLIIADVGQGSREEVSIGSSTVGGQNFGWGNYEGFDYIPLPGTNPFTGLSYELNQPTSFDIPQELEVRTMQHKLPEFDYGHNGNFDTRFALFNNGVLELESDINAIEGNSITGGAFIIGDGFGEQYNGAYVFSDYTRGWLNMAMPNQDSTGRYFSNTVNFAPTDTFSSPVDITQGLDGNLYVVNLFGDIDMISFESTLSSEGATVETIQITYLSNYGQISIKGIRERSSLVIFDTSGRKVFFEDVSVGDNIYDLYLEKGVYIVKVGNGFVKKIIVR